MTLRRPTLPLLATLVALTACGSGGESGTPGESTGAAQTAAVPEVKNPKIMGFEFGHALDTAGAIFGGIANTFAAADTVFVGITTIHVPSGGRVEARFLEGNRIAAVDSASTGAPDSTGVARVGLRLVPKSGWKAGAQQIEVFLDGVSQGAKPLTIQ